MSFTLNIETDFSPKEVTETIRSALEHEKHVAKYKVKRYSAICKEFEEKKGFSDFLEWYAAKRGMDHWSKKLELLSGISLEKKL
jgi:ferritin